jgi:hypothetical protein
MPDRPVQHVRVRGIRLAAVDGHRELGELALQSGQARQRRIHLVERDLIRPDLVRCQVRLREQRKHWLSGLVKLAEPLPTFLKPVAGITNVDPSRQLQFGLKLIF